MKPLYLTGTILALSRALGEAAPLILFGALGHVENIPTFFSQFTVLPIQIYFWADDPRAASAYNAAMAMVVLMISILALNATAIYLRQRAQREMKW